MQLSVCQELTIVGFVLLASLITIIVTATAGAHTLSPGAQGFIIFASVVGMIVTVWCLVLRQRRRQEDSGFGLGTHGTHAMGGDSGV